MLIMERLQKILSQAGVASRRASEQLMLEGRVTVNGVTVHGARDEGGARQGRHPRRRTARQSRRASSVSAPEQAARLRHDPVGSAAAPDGHRSAARVREYVYPVGRLDYESEGLLLLTNDGDLAARLTHPSHEVARVYEARVLGVPDAHDLDRLSRGLVIDGRRTAPAEVRLMPLRRDATEATLVITIHEGRNRQVRDMCEAIGHPVEHLRRVAIGPIRDAKLKLGHWRELNEEEVDATEKSGRR